MPKSRDISEKKLVITLQDEDGNIISRLPTNVSASQLKIGHPLNTKQDLQKVADNLETAIGDVIEQLKAPLLSIILSNQPEKPEQTANAVKPAQSSADVKIKKKLRVQTLYGETHANAKICTALKVNPNATARSLAVDKLLAEEQIEGLSYRGAGKLIQQSNHLKIAPGTIHDYVSQTGAFIRKTADEERSAIFKASDYTEEGFLENIQEAQQRFGIIKLKAHPLATELAKVLGMFNTKLEADWLQMPKAKRPLQPQRVSSIAFLPTLECWDGKLQLLIASSVKEGFKTLIAFLLHNGLINRHKVFFIDGAGVLKTQIDKYFSYCSYQINLDWYHVTEQIDSMIGRGTAGSHEERRAYRDAVKKALWYFNYKDALQYIDKLIAEHSTKERSVILQSAKNYINNKVTLFSCYAMRKYLGLPNSSNTIERYNGLTVSNRQKHRGCSWSNLGSNSQTLLSSTNLNKELDKLLKSANYEDYTIDLFKAA